MLSEAEWEYAARAGVATAYPWGDTITHSQANYFSDAQYAYDTSATRRFHPAYNDGPYPYSSPVGGFAPNGYGLYDMAGNMWERCWDWYFNGYYASSPGSDPQGAVSGTLRAIRSGGWINFATDCRVAYRSGFDPSNAGENSNVGFRLARSAVP